MQKLMLCLFCGLSTFQLRPFACGACRQALLRAFIEDRHWWTLESKMGLALRGQSLGWNESRKYDGLIRCQKSFAIRDILGKNVWSLVLKRSFAVYGHQELTLIPLPSTTKRKHAHRLAQEICETLKGQATLADCLCHKTQRRPNKLLSRKERYQKQIQLVPEFSHHRENFKKIILIDDQITTGATLWNAWQALSDAQRADTEIEFFSLTRQPRPPLPR